MCDSKQQLEIMSDPENSSYSLPLDVEDFLLKCGIFLDKDGGWVPEDRRDEIRSRLHRMAGRILDKYSTENAEL